MKKVSIFIYFFTLLLTVGACHEKDFFDFFKEIKKKKGKGDPGLVFTSTNDPAGNEIVVYGRHTDGTLKEINTYATDGEGTGMGLGSQNAVILDKSKQLLFVVNAGSNEISVFSISQDGIQLEENIASGGEMPISLTVHKKLLYVLNAGGSGNITGFYVGNSGSLTPIAGSTQVLSNNGAGSAPGPAQIEFTPDGKTLVVTEKPSNKILTYAVGNDGKPADPVINDSAGETPFGFGFTTQGYLLVSEAYGGAENAGVLSSYSMNPDGTLTVISPEVATHQTAICWVAITNNNRYAYGTNTGSGSVSGFKVSSDGSVSLLDPDGRTGITGDGTSPIDMALSTNSRFLYALNAREGSISAFKVENDGSLTDIDKYTGLPASPVGLAAK
jgi:6-phosphogluconolactonase (cycloisomerase 2 family)